MDILKRKADQLANSFLFNDANINDLQFIDSIKKEQSIIEDKADKIRFIKMLLNRCDIDYFIVKAFNPRPLEYEGSYAHENVQYFLRQQLFALGVNLNEDTFSSEEEVQIQKILEKILNDLNEVKTGQEIIFNEISEMKDFLYLGKKNWYQLLRGKAIEMVAGGIISETLSTEIVSEVKKIIPSLLTVG